jgi:membrane-associated protease RseP (regulator of RpoE activity)
MRSQKAVPDRDESRDAAIARLARLVDGEVTIGHSEPMMLLLTGDADGYPRHCALSRTELEVVGPSLHAALHARRTVANLERDGAAVLVAVDQAEIVSFRLVVQAIVRADGPVGVRLDIVAVEADSLGIDLTAPSFVPTTELARSEHWDRTRSVLTALRSSGTVS